MECFLKLGVFDQFAQLKPKLDTILGNVNGMIINLNTQLGSGDNGALKKTISEVSTTLQSINRLANNADKMVVGLDNTLTSNKGNIDGILKNVSQLTAKLNGETGKIDSILTNFQNIIKQTGSTGITTNG